MNIGPIIIETFETYIRFKRSWTSSKNNFPIFFLKNQKFICIFIYRKYIFIYRKYICFLVKIFTKVDPEKAKVDSLYCGIQFMPKFFTCNSSITISLATDQCNIWGLIKILCNELQIKTIIKYHFK